MATGDLVLSALFSDYAVLQQGCQVRIFGGGAVADETVSGELAGHMASGVAKKDGAWEVELPALPPGSPPV